MRRRLIIADAVGLALAFLVAELLFGAHGPGGSAEPDERVPAVRPHPARLGRSGQAVPALRQRRRAHGSLHDRRLRRRLPPRDGGCVARVRRGVGVRCCQPRHDQARHVLGACGRSRHRRTCDRAGHGQAPKRLRAKGDHRRCRRRRPADRPQAHAAQGIRHRGRRPRRRKPQGSTRGPCRPAGARGDGRDRIVDSRARRRADRDRVLERPARSRVGARPSTGEARRSNRHRPTALRGRGPHVKVHKVEGIALVALPAAKRFPLRDSSSAGWTSYSHPWHSFSPRRSSRTSRGESAATLPAPCSSGRAGSGSTKREFTVLKFRTMRVDTDDAAHREFIKQTMTLVGDPDGEWALQARARGRSDALRPVPPADEPRRVAAADQRAARRDGDGRAASVPSLTRPSTPSPHHFERFDVPQGITGLWQVTARAHATFGEALDMDVLYARSWSLGLDLGLLVRALRFTFFDERAPHERAVAGEKPVRVAVVGLGYWGPNLVKEPAGHRGRRAEPSSATCARGATRRDRTALSERSYPRRSSL